MTARYIEIYGSVTPTPPPPPPPPVAPSVPLNPRATEDVIGDDVLFEWDAPESPGSSPITEFIVTVNGVDQVVASGVATEYRVFNYTPDTEYTFAVAAKNAAGTGPKTANVSVRTNPAGKPPAPVLTNVMLGDPILVEFTKVDATPPVTEYICVAQKGTDDPKEFSVASTKPAAIPVTGYVTGDVVTFTVYAVNSDGRSVGSNQETVTIP
jgi:hypothetical protein